MTARAVNPTPARLGLRAASSPFVDESCSSWVQRLCGDHQYSMARMEAVLGFAVDDRDWDRPIPADAWSRVVEMTGLEQFRNLGGLRVLADLEHCAAHSRLLWSDRAQPRYRFCASCLASDQVPYFRWQWRLAAVQECWVHGTPLHEQCPWCNAPVLMHRSRLVLIGRWGRAFQLNGCDLCGMGMADAVLTPPSTMVNRSAQRRLKTALIPLCGLQAEATPSSLAAAVAELAAAAVARKGRPRPPGQARAEPVPEPAPAADKRDLPDQGIQAARARSDHYLRQRLAEKARDAAWVLNAESFQRVFEIPTPAARPEPDWRWRLGPARRLKVASALRMIRRARREE